MNDLNTFRTERLQLAIYLHATGLLRLLNCEQSRPGKLYFVFADSGNRGTEYELEFDRGATVAGVAIFASQKYLRRLMTQQFENLNTGRGNDRNLTAAAR